MRGTLRCQSKMNLCSRFIPAHAGNTRSDQKHDHAGSVHPRACGEHCGSGLGLIVGSGSSPRMRGTQSPLRSNVDHRRFIPAHAGNTCRQWPRSRLGTVHPRACGEHASSSARITLSGGSSPRMRGTLMMPGDPAIFRRFIPAHAGNTWVTRRCSRVTTVHPRACGEHNTAWLRAALGSPVATGSSPRMRGTPNRFQSRLEQFRFIPAHAGNTMYCG